MAKTPAEKMRDYRQRKKEAGYVQHNTWVQVGELVPNETTEAESPQAQWEKKLKHEQLLAARKEGRRLAKLEDNSLDHGRTTGLCEAAVFLIDKDKIDIAQDLLDYYGIDRERAEGALQADKRTRSLTLENLDRAGIWEVMK